MIEKEFSEAAVEMNCILENMSGELLDKIPDSLKKCFKKAASRTYTFEYDKTKSLEEQDLKAETKGIIALIYSMYICDEIGQKEYIQKYNRFINKN